MKRKLLFLLPALGCVGFSFFYTGETVSTYHSDGITAVDFSSNPPASKTGAPGDGNCTDCHSGETMSGEGVLFFTVGGGPSYIPGATYPITISTLDGAKNGFELTILDSDNNQAGTLTADVNSNVTTAGGREYIRHSNSLGALSWTFNWTAPDTDAGELTAYYALNKANNNGNNSGDEIFLGNTAIPLHGVSIKENELEKAFKIYFNDQTRELNLNYALVQESKVVLNIQDLSGRLIEYYDFGRETSGDYSKKLPVTKVDKAGVYILSLFVNNRVLNRKVVFQ